MGQESFDYILNIEHRLNKTGVLLAIPMYMYRVETKSIEYGINFFQKAVLMLKTKPGIDNSVIAACLGLDEKLIHLVSEQLVSNKLLGEDGRLTAQGQEKKNDIDGLIVDHNKKTIGYVFQHINDDGLYPFYVNNIRKASVLNGEICTGSKGETGDEDFYAKPISADGLLDNRVTNYAPNEREIISLIRRSNKHAHSNKDIDTLPIDSQNYGISFVPNNHPTVVWICTYAYVPRIKDDMYSSDWEIQDPFGFENNSELKVYVESLLTEGYIEDFSYKFKDLKTTQGLTIDNYNAMMDGLVDEEMGRTFDIDFHKLDRNLLKYLRNVIWKYLELKRTIETEICGNYVTYIQKALEVIFKLDFEKNPKVYKILFNNIKYERRRNGMHNDLYNSSDRQDCIEELYYSHGLKVDSQTLKNLKDFSRKFDPSSTSSLKHYLMKFLLAHKYDLNNPLYEIIKEKVGVIYAIANLRNMGSHGQTSNEQQMRALSSVDIDLYFGELKQIVNNYIIRYNG